MYQRGHYDLGGFAVGAVERDQILPRGDITPGDVIIGLPSSGVHSNAFSLVRRLIAEENLDWGHAAPWDTKQSVAEALLVPTRLYVKPLLAAIRATGGSGADGAICGLAHITGGGLTENIPRVMPAGIAAHIDLDKIDVPPVFGWMRSAGRLEQDEMLRTFNCGIGMIIVAAKAKADAVIAALHAAGEFPVVMGEVEAGRGIKSSAKGKGDAEAIRVSGRGRF